MIRFGHDKASHPRHDHRGPPRYLSSRDQTRLLMMVLLLGLVVILMVEARKPTNWSWLYHVGDAKASVEAGQEARPGGSEMPQVDPASGAAASAEHGGTEKNKTAVGDAYFPGITPADIAKLQDNTVFLSSETDVWQRWLSVLHNADQPSLEAASIGPVSYVQLLRQTAELRGRLATVDGTVRRSFYLNAPPALAPLKGYWQCWLFANQVDASPVVVYTLEMPEGFPRGMELDEPVQFTGLVYKRWAYQSAGGIRVAPLLLAKTGKWTPHSPQASQPASGFPGIGLTVAMAAVLGIGTAWLVWAYGRRTSNRARR